MPAVWLASRKQNFRRYTVWRELKWPSATVAHDDSIKALYAFTNSSVWPPGFRFMLQHFQTWCCASQWPRPTPTDKSMHSFKSASRLCHAGACSRDIPFTHLQTTNNYISNMTSELQNEPDIASALQGSLRDCQYTHAYMVEAGLTGDVFLVNLVLRAYSKFGTMSDACAVFDGMPRPSIISWNTMIGGYINVYSVDEARLFFDRMFQRNVVTWNTLITAYARHVKSKEALHLFQRMYLESGLPNDVTFINVLSVCSQLVDLKTGRLIHVLICGCGLASSLTVGTTLINMYAKSNDLKSAHFAFHKLSQYDVASWTSLISAYARLEKGEVAFDLYRRMQQEGIQPNKLTIQSTLSAIANKLLLREGKAIHSCVCFGDSRLDVDIGSALINMYGKCGSIKYAWLVFKDVKLNATSVWNAMIAACVDQTCYWQALSLYYQGLQKGLKLDEVTFANVLSASALVVNLNIGLLIHTHIVEEGHEPDVVVSNTLITFYSRCNALEDAIAVFKKMRSYSVVTWTCMIAAYGQGGLNRQAVELFQQMQLQHVKPNDVTIATALGACADSIALEEGRMLHVWISFERNVLNSAVRSAIVNMYGKCGALADAFSVFKSLGVLENIVLWNAMISGFAYGGHGGEALLCFFRLQGECIQLDEFTFVGLLSACSHAGMVDEGICCFCYVASSLYIRLLLEHCVCIIDLFGRAGQLAEAQSFVYKVPFLPDVCLWSALEAVSRTHGDSVCGKWASEQILEFG
ncbi:hypothetical protein GOP47_0024174 [Adiantum capillus-veneris]|uniref:Pentatricopeptide repeat-containing protein n=1 Tax=Adiantum capillus-veneris TaxID=13818 RepID=A0A9D4U4X3_ADICA|nr:hypothetical protein GOP47_0024174 [Adiantum capillus-veneris]